MAKSWLEEAVRVEPADEVEAWAMEYNLADRVDYKGVPARMAHAWNVAVFDTLTDFPAIRSLLGFIGSLSAWNHLIRHDEERWCVETVRKRVPGMDEAEIERAAHRAAQRAFRSRAASHASGMACTCAGLVSGIFINPRGFRRAPTDAQVRRVADHELGHLLDALLNMNTVPLMRRLALEYPYAAVCSELGEYAGEFIAVGWESFRNDPAPSQLARTVGLTIIDQYRARYGTASEAGNGASADGPLEVCRLPPAAVALP